MSGGREQASQSNLSCSAGYCLRKNHRRPVFIRGLRANGSILGSLTSNTPVIRQRPTTTTSQKAGGPKGEFEALGSSGFGSPGPPNRLEKGHTGASLPNIFSLAVSGRLHPAVSATDRRPDKVFDRTLAHGVTSQWSAGQATRLSKSAPARFATGE